MREFLRPWKLATLVFGIAALCAGADIYHAPDWDYGISFVMAIGAYLTAPSSLRAILDAIHYRSLRTIVYVLPALLLWILTVDTSWLAYWTLKTHGNMGLILEMRGPNFFASTSLYFGCGVLWLYRGSLEELLADLQAVGKLLRRPK